MVTLDDLKMHLRMDQDYEDEDENLERILLEAADWAYSITGIVNDESAPYRFDSLVKQKAGELHSYRNGLVEIAVKENPSFRYLISSLRKPVSGLMTGTEQS